MASWIDEVIGMWDPHGGGGNSGNCFGCFAGIVLGGALLILVLSLLGNAWEFLRGLDLGFTLPDLSGWDWAEALAEFPNVMMSIFKFIGDILYNIAQFIYRFW